MRPSITTAKADDAEHRKEISHGVDSAYGLLTESQQGLIGLNKISIGPVTAAAGRDPYDNGVVRRRLVGSVVGIVVSLGSGRPCCR